MLSQNMNNSTVQYTKRKLKHSHFCIKKNTQGFKELHLQKHRMEIFNPDVDFCSIAQGGSGIQVLLSALPLKGT